MAEGQGRDEGLVLHHEELRVNTARLFDRLREDEEAQQAFIRDPARHVAEHVLNSELPDQHASDANRVLFEMLANDEFREWLDQYESSPGGERVSDEQFARDFAEAVLKFGDPDLLGSLLAHASNGGRVPGGSVFQQFVTGPDRTFVTSPATPSTSDQSLNSSQNFNNNSSGFQFGLGDAVDPAVMRAVTDQIISRAKELKQAGELANRQQHL